jgi:hypothetical protein
MFKEVSIAKEIDLVVAISLFLSWAFKLIIYGSTIAVFALVPALFILLILCTDLGYSMNNPIFAYVIFITSAIYTTGIHHIKIFKIFFEE